MIQKIVYLLDIYYNYDFDKQNNEEIKKDSRYIIKRNKLTKGINR